MARFSAQIRVFGDKTGKVMTDVITMAATTLFTNIIKRTPHETGRAMANWQLAVDEPDPEGTFPKVVCVKFCNFETVA